MEPNNAVAAATAEGATLLDATTGTSLTHGIKGLYQWTFRLFALSDNTNHYQEHLFIRENSSSFSNHNSFSFQTLFIMPKTSLAFTTIIWGAIVLLLFTIWIAAAATTPSTSSTSKSSSPTSTAFGNFFFWGKTQNRTIPSSSNGIDGDSNSSHSNREKKWWPDLKPPMTSPFRILLPEEEDDIFFADEEEEKYDDDIFHSDNNEEDENMYRGRWATRAATNTKNKYSAPQAAASIRKSNRTTGSNKTSAETTGTDGTTESCSNAAASDFLGVSHFCFLVHGHRGHSRDLSYVQAVMRRFQKRRFPTDRPMVTTAATSSFTNSDPSCDSQPRQCSEDVAVASQNQRTDSRLIVHSCICNEKKTDDGIAAGGERLVDEILQVIRESMGAIAAMPLSSSGNPNDKSLTTGTSTTSPNKANDSANLRHVTISLWGNSLGGLYARYALALLSDRCQQTCRNPNWLSMTSDSKTNRSSLFFVLDDAYAIHLNIFCTTATPHLGVSGHTFVSLPRTAEIGVAHAMGDTGKDLFRLNSLLREMATNKMYIIPLSSFAKRICYANAYGTDFPVPACTAAFLSTSSSYPHHFSQTVSDPDIDSRDDDPKQLSQPDSPRTSLVIATLHTPAAHECNPHRGDRGAIDLRGTKGIQKDFRANAFEVINNREGGEHATTNDDESEVAESDLDKELAQMSMSLDCLGWKKVFVDMRKEVPRISIPKSLISRLTASTSTNNLKEDAGGDSKSDSFSLNSSETASNSSDDEACDEAVLPNDSDLRTSSSSLAPQSMESLRCRGSAVSSKDIAAAVLASPALSDDELFALHWPIGHNMIVAFSRSRWSAYMNKAGRPVVDALAKELVEDIFGFVIPQSFSATTGNV